MGANNTNWGGLADNCTRLRIGPYRIVLYSLGALGVGRGVV